jgi:endonuclease YncB( thermonuclease family)
MRRALFFLLLAATVGSPAAASELWGVAKVVGVDENDGRIELEGGARFTLWGVQFPPAHERCSAGGLDFSCRTAAIGFLRSIILGREVTCERDRDELARVTYAWPCKIDGHDIGEAIVAAGWASENPASAAGVYASGEAEARRSKRGMWGMRTR